jgi:hypothetical protein
MDIGEQPTDKWPEGFGEHDGGTVKDVGNDDVLYLVHPSPGNAITFNQSWLRNPSQPALKTRHLASEDHGGMVIALRTP